MVETPEPKVQLHSGPLPLKLKFNQPILKGGRSLDVIKNSPRGTDLSETCRLVEISNDAAL